MIIHMRESETERDRGRGGRGICERVCVPIYSRVCRACARQVHDAREEAVSSVKSLRETNREGKEKLAYMERRISSGAGCGGIETCWAVRQTQYHNS